MYKAVWKFTVRPEKQREFESVYGPDGDWAQLFRKSQDYIGTELFRSLNDNSYITVDKWNSEANFETFKNQFRSEYKKLDTECERFTLQEERIP